MGITLEGNLSSYENASGPLAKVEVNFRGLVELAWKRWEHSPEEAMIYGKTDGKMYMGFGEAKKTRDDPAEGSRSLVGKE